MRKILILAAASGFIFAANPLAQAQEARPVSFVDLAERLSPAVVNISTSQNIEANVEMPAFPKGSPLERYNDFFGNGEGRIASSLGSGFVIDKQGHIATNNHVIEDADLIEVTFPNGETYAAKLIGRDPATDVAVLKIDAGMDLPFVKWGDSDEAKVGEWVVAIGNPFGYAGTVTAGIISARNRNIGNSRFDDFIQSDVAINRGNSGGPLFNMQGEVIGMNTAIISPTGGSVGISFTTPSNLVALTVEQLQKFGETRRGYLGASVQKVSKDNAASFKLDKPTGGLITRIEKDGPAAAAGLKRGDLILSYEGRPLEKSADLSLWVAQTAVDKTVNVTYLRKGDKKTQTAKVKITRLKEEVLAPEEAVLPAKSVAMGVAVETLTDALRRKYRIGADAKGVIVTSVDGKGEASGKLRIGDVIEQIELVDVKSVEDFKTKVANAKTAETPLMILVNRGGNYVFYSVRANS